MSLEEIKSPLPPRKVVFNEPEEIKEQVKLDSSPLSAENNGMPVVLQPPKKDKKKFLIIGGIGAVIVLLIVLIFTVFLPRFGGEVKEDVVLNYWGLWESDSVMSGLIAEFETKNPGIKINYKMNQKDNYRSRLSGRLAKSGIEENVPDIFRIHNTWIPMFEEHLEAVPNETAISLEMDTDFYETYKSLKRGGQYLAIPLMYDGLALFYNKDLIESAQLDLPKSWWDLKTAATKLTVKDEEGKIKVAGVAMGLADNVDHWSDIIGVMMEQNGVDPLNESVDNVKKLQDVLAFYTIFKSQDQVWDESLPPSTQLFANGKLAFYFGPSWRVFNIKDINPNLRYNIITVPQLPTLENASLDQTDPNATLTNVHWASYWVEGVNNKSKKQKEAWKFMEFLASKEGLEKMYTTASQTRDFGGIYPRKSMAGKISANSKILPYITAADNSVSWYLSSNTYDDGLNDEMQKYFKDAINSMVFRGSDAESIMSTLRSGIGQIRTKYKLK